jgi:hypothetical protein
MKGIVAMKKISVLALCFVILLAFAGCGSKTAITGEQFTDIVKGHSFTVSDSMTPEDASLYDTELFAENGTDMFIYLNVNDTAEPLGVFGGIKSQVEALKGNVNTETSAQGSGSAKYTLSTNGKFYAISLIGNTLVYAEADAANKDEIKDILTELGY